MVKQANLFFSTLQLFELWDCVQFVDRYHCQFQTLNSTITVSIASKGVYFLKVGTVSSQQLFEKVLKYTKRFKTALNNSGWIFPPPTRDTHNCSYCKKCLFSVDSWCGLEDPAFFIMIEKCICVYLVKFDIFSSSW